MPRLPQSHRLLSLAVAVPALAGAGFIAAIAPRSAGADLLPTTTLTLPGVSTTVPVTVPTLPPLPSLTTTTTPPDPSSTSTSAAPPPTASSSTEGSGTADPTAGAASAADRLLIERLWITPTVVRLHRVFVLSARVGDGRGGAMRGALVSLTFKPAGSIGRVRARTTGASGTVRFTLRPAKRLSLRNGRLAIVVSARAGTLLARRTISVRVKR